MAVDKKNHWLLKSKTHIKEQMYWKEEGEKEKNKGIFNV